jgi:hypothetical protein
MSKDNNSSEVNISPRPNVNKNGTGWREFLLKGFTDLHKLQPKYYKLTSGLGMIGVVTLIALMLICDHLIGRILSIGGGDDLRSHPPGLLYIFLFVVFSPIAAYTAMVFVAGVFSIVMICLGRMTRSEGVRYTFLSHYPDYWMQRRFRKTP